MGIDDVTAEWLAQVTGIPPGARVTREVVGAGQVAQCFRLSATWANESRSFVVKVPSADETSRATASFQRLYLREVSFYRDLAPSLATRTPHCYYVEHDPSDDSFLLLLEDLAPSSSHDQFKGLDPRAVRDGLFQLATLHAATYAQPQLFAADWLAGTAEALRPVIAAILPDLFAQFLERYDEMLDTATREHVETLAERLGSFVQYESPHLVLQHGDFRTDNLLFDARGGDVPIAVVDWQTVSVGSPLLDVAYFLATSLSEADFAAGAERLLLYYLEHAARRGLVIEEGLARREFARFTLQPIVMSVAASMIVERTPRGDEMFLTMIRRGVVAASKWRALEELEHGVTS